MADKVPINVLMTKAEEERVYREDARWTAPRLVGLAALVLGVALTGLWFASSAPWSQDTDSDSGQILRWVSSD